MGLGLCGKLYSPGIGHHYGQQPSTRLGSLKKTLIKYPLLSQFISFQGYMEALNPLLQMWCPPGIKSPFEPSVRIVIDVRVPIFYPSATLSLSLSLSLSLPFPSTRPPPLSRSIVLQFRARVEGSAPKIPKCSHRQATRRGYTG